MMMMRLCEEKESKKLVKKEESGLEKRMSEWSKDEPKNHTQNFSVSTGRRLARRQNERIQRGQRPGGLEEAVLQKIEKF